MPDPAAPLLERGRRLAGRLERFDQLRRDAKMAERLSERAKTLDGRAKSLRTLIAARTLLLGGGLDLSACPKPSAELRAKPSVLLQNLQGSRLAFTGDNGELRDTFLEPVAEHEKKLRAALLKAWQSYVAKVSTPVEEATLSAFDQAGFSQEVVRIRVLLDERKRLSDTLPGSAEDIARVGAINQEIANIWGSLKGVPEDVLGFLRRAASGVATLSDLVAPVQAWLSQHQDVAKRLRIKLA